MNNCAICGRFLPKVDALPFGAGVAHFWCAAKASLPGAARPGKVLVFVRKRGPAFERKAVS